MKDQDLGSSGCIRIGCIVRDRYSVPHNNLFVRISCSVSLEGSLARLTNGHDAK